MPILSFLLTFPEATPEKVEKWHEMNSYRLAFLLKRKRSINNFANKLVVRKLS